RTLLILRAATAATTDRADHAAIAHDRRRAGSREHVAAQAVRHGLPESPALGCMGGQLGRRGAKCGRGDCLGTCGIWSEEASTVATGTQYEPSTLIDHGHSHRSP